MNVNKIKEWPGFCAAVGDTGHLETGKAGPWEGNTNQVREISQG
jgi:hypothetical protein